jgi:hypothetical protein
MNVTQQLALSLFLAGLAALLQVASRLPVQMPHYSCEQLFDCCDVCPAHLPLQLELPRRLENRLHRSVADFDAAMASLRAAYGAAPYEPSFGPLEELEQGVVYLDRIDEQFRRYYVRRS